MSRKRGMQVGAAAFALGISLAGPQIAIASADRPTDADEPSVSAGTDTAARGHQSRPGKSRSTSAPVGARAAESSDPRARHNRSRPTRTTEPAPAPVPLTAPDIRPAASVAVPVRAPRATTPATAATLQTATPTAMAAPTATAAVDPDCALCRAAQAQSIGQGLTAAVNRAFNSTFTLLANGGPLSDLFTGALVLVRRSLFLIPEGVTAGQSGTELTVGVDTGSVAYFRQDGSGVQVSGDPRFWGAKTYNGTVTVSVTGNSGGAGVVLTAGMINGDLDADLIDSIRFEAGSSFTGQVIAAGPGPITLRDGVRGLGGVTIDAPEIVLANDVEIDAGTHDATFGGTVDAAEAGEQSLTVTALGTTTFAGDVGGTAALSSLLTRGITPVVITQSDNTKTIPLHFLPWAQNPDTGKTQVKYGIDVAIGDNPSQVYEFDTGGNGFFAGYNPPFWKDVPLSSTPVSIVFTSGNNFQAVVATPTVTIGQGAQTVSTQPIDIGAIMSGSSGKDGAFDFTDPAAPPIEGGFFGDFGASLATLAVSGSSAVLANPLLQLPGTLSNGYLVQLGPIGVTPQVTVGLTDDLRAQFPYAVPISPTGTGTYPVSGWPLLNLFGVSPTYYAQLGSTERVPIGPGTLPTVVDSGAPTLSIRLNGAEGPYETKDGQLQPGVKFIAEFPTAEGKTALTWTVVAGNNPSVDQINYGDSSAAFTAENLNTGLNLYNFYDVIFDVQDQVLRLRPTGGQATVVAHSVTTTGAQTYRQNAELGGLYLTGGADFSVAGVTSLRDDTVIEAGAGDVTFSGTVDTLVPAASPVALIRSLVVNSSGATRFAQTVGGLNPLKSLVTDPGGSAETFQVSTAQSQSYGDASITLKGQYFTTAGDFSVSGDATLAAGVTVETQSEDGAITFGGRIDAENGRGYPLALYTNGGPVTLTGNIGSTYPLGGLTVDNVAATGTAQFTSSGTIALDGSLGFANTDGLVIDSGVAANLTSGGVVRDFGGDGIQVDTNDSRLSGFAVSGNATSGIHLDGAKDVELSDNVIYTNGKDGILSSDSDSIQITGNTIGNNGRDGVRVETGHGNAILSNSIFANGAGIALVDGGNDGQPAPTDVVATVANSFLIVAGNLDTPGDYTFQVFFSPAADSPDIQGRKFLGQQNISITGREWALPLALETTLPAGFITVTATPVTGRPDTSEFSNAAAIAGG